MTCTFTSSSLGSMQKFTVDMFSQLSPQDEPVLFKLAAKQAIDLHPDSSRPALIEVSTKYQVLSEHTSFIGIVKNKDKVEGELQKIVMPTITS